MKILLYSMNFAPEPTSTGKYSGEMGIWLAQRGHDVRAICAPPYYPEWKVAEGYSTFRYRRETLHGVDVRRCPVWIPSRPNGMKRLLCMTVFAVTSTWEAFKSLFWRPDIVIVVEPTIACAPAALVCARLGRARSWLHVQDFEVDAALDLGMLRIGALQKIARAMDGFLTRRFDRRSTISVRMIEKLAEKAPDTQHNVLFPNWVGCSEIHPIPSSSFRKTLALPATQKVALYAGNIGRKQGLEVVIEAARVLQHRTDLTFVICGSGAAWQQIHAMGVDLQNITWLPVQPIEKLNDLLGLADVHLLPQVAGAADLVMPSKLTGMLASGRPVLATADPGTQVYDVVTQVGRVVSPGDSKLFAATLEEMLSSEQELTKLGLAARKLAEKTLGKEAILERFEQQLLNAAAQD